MKKVNNRKVFLINKQFQISILSWFSALAMTIICIFYASIWYFFYKFKLQGLEAGIPEGHIFYKFINEQQLVMDKIFLVTSIVAVFIIFLGGLFLSHKVAGPLYRLTQHLKSKSLSSLKFRDGDYFPEIQEAFNEYIKK